MGSFARHLYDAFYLYASSLKTADEMIANGRKDAATMTEAMQGSFIGLTGNVTIDPNGNRIPYFVVYGLDNNAQQQSFLDITVLNETDADLTVLYSDEATSIWQTRKGLRPLTVPICGYSGTECPRTFWEQYLIYIVIGGALALVLLITTLCLAVYAIRSAKEKIRRLNAEWQIPHVLLERVKKGDRRSRRSLQSGPSTITSDSTFEAEDSKFELFVMNNLRKLEHDNVNKFIGASIDGGQYFVVWRICSRGSLQTIITKGSFTIDSFFVVCIIRDIAEGLNYLHRSFVGAIGTLSSCTCLVNDGWQVKISAYGTPFFVDHEAQKR
ncbi:unnamed protein product [Nippostrongylus brasiliensis]|uniref:guanylate cyclase n=1 Tax=Nippostrongylus brasiliensis TaxID=27835 RepID=A0A0N4YMW5_NIPBR|nr:unnamed protein product [Nippostrongylus brasiliensis]